MKFTVIKPQTAAVSASSSTVFKSDQCREQYFHVIADTLAGAEEVDIEVYAGNDIWLAYEEAAGPVVLTATIPMQWLRAGPLYRFAKDATAGACGVIIQYCPYNN